MEFGEYVKRRAVMVVKQIWVDLKREGLWDVEVGLLKGDKATFLCGKNVQGCKRMIFQGQLAFPITLFYSRQRQKYREKQLVLTLKASSLPSKPDLVQIPIQADLIVGHDQAFTKTLTNLTLKYRCFVRLGDFQSDSLTLSKKEHSYKLCDLPAILPPFKAEKVAEVVELEEMEMIREKEGLQQEIEQYKRMAEQISSTIHTLQKKYLEQKQVSLLEKEQIACQQDNASLKSRILLMRNSIQTYHQQLKQNHAALALQKQHSDSLLRQKRDLESRMMSFNEKRMELVTACLQKSEVKLLAMLEKEQVLE